MDYVTCEQCGGFLAGPGHSAGLAYRIVQCERRRCQRWQAIVSRGSELIGTVDVHVSMRRVCLGLSALDGITEPERADVAEFVLRWMLAREERMEAAA